MRPPLAVETLSVTQAAAARIQASGVRYVGLLDVNSPAGPVGLFAAAYAGVPYVPINYRLTRPEINELVARVAQVLLVGTIFFCLEVVLGAGLLATGHPGLHSVGQIVAAVVTVVVVRGVMLVRSGRTTAAESESDEERRY